MAVISVLGGMLLVASPEQKHILRHYESAPTRSKPTSIDSKLSSPNVCARTSLLLFSFGRSQETMPRQMMGVIRKPTRPP